MTTILLVDHHDVVRAGVRRLLEAEDEFTVVGEAADGLVVDQLVAQLHPDVLIINVMLPSGCGLEVTQQVRQRHPRTHVVILTMQTNPDYVALALHNGAAAYVLKHAPAAELMQAVRAAAVGQRYLSPALAEHGVTPAGTPPLAPPQNPLGPLTSRERDVFFLVAESCTNPEIATRLSISPRTAEQHRANVMRKLGVQTLTDLIRYALQHGLIPLER
jgi:DNA-binding NarL/FixJ family response regulator